MKRQAIVAQGTVEGLAAEDQGIAAGPAMGWCAASLRFRAYRDAADAGCLR